MERLTERTAAGVANINYSGCYFDDEMLDKIAESARRQTVIERLASIEDILGDDYDLDRLRELVERMRGEWVAKHRHRGGFRRVTGVDDTGEQRTITIDERCEYDDRYCSRCGKQSPDNFLNFCGYCGAPMTDEAVEMVMERMEALHGQENS